MFVLICAILLIGFGIYYHNQDRPLTATQYLIGGGLCLRFLYFQSTTIRPAIIFLGA